MVLNPCWNSIVTSPRLKLLSRLSRDYIHIKKLAITLTSIRNTLAWPDSFNVFSSLSPCWVMHECIFCLDTVYRCNMAKVVFFIDERKSSTVTLEIIDQQWSKSKIFIVELCFTVPLEVRKKMLENIRSFSLLLIQCWSQGQYHECHGSGNFLPRKNPSQCTIGCCVMI